MIKDTIYNQRDASKLFLYFSLLILFLTGFPLAQGWLPIGDFRPRVLFLLVALALYPKRFLSKDLIWLYLFFIYQTVAYLLSDTILEPINLLSRLMEYLVPIIIVPTALAIKSNNYRIVGKYAVVTTILTVLLTLSVVSLFPDIIRDMVTHSAWDGIDVVRNYWRMGVCSYSFALIMMCIPPILLQRFFLSQRRWEKILYILFCLLITYFVYVAQVTTTFFICLIMLFLVWFTRRMSMKKTIIWVALLILLGLLSLNVLLPLLLKLFGVETEIGLHLLGMNQFLFEGGTVSNDAYAVDKRAELYEFSINAFIRHPLFGTITERIGGHNFGLDTLARFGLVGSLPLFLFFYNRFRITSSYMSETDKKLYLIIVIGFVALLFTKNVVGIDHWAYLFLYIPCFLRMTNTEKNRI